MKNKITLLYLLGFLLLSSGVYAQGFVGVKFSVNVPGLPEPVVNEDFTSRLGGGVGLDIGYRFSDYIGIKALMEYTEISRKRNAFQGFYIPGNIENDFPSLGDIDVAYADLDGDVKDKYLLLPVMLEFGFTFNEKVFNDVREEYLRVYVSGGGFVGYLAESRQRIRSLRSNVYADRERTEMLASRQAVYDSGFRRSSNYVTDNLERFTYGVTGYLGFSYHFFYRNEFYIEVGGNYGLVNLDDKKVNGELFTRSATVQIGYRWQL